MKELRELLYTAWIEGFKAGLYPGSMPPFEDWYNTLDIKAWLIAGNAAKEIE